MKIKFIYLFLFFTIGFIFIGVGCTQISLPSIHQQANKTQHPIVVPTHSMPRSAFDNSLVSPNERWFVQTTHTTSTHKRSVNTVILINRKTKVHHILFSQVESISNTNVRWQPAGWSADGTAVFLLADTTVYRVPLSIPKLQELIAPVPTHISIHQQNVHSQSVSDATDILFYDSRILDLLPSHNIVLMMRTVQPCRNVDCETAQRQISFFSLQTRFITPLFIINNQKQNMYIDTAVLNPSGTRIAVVTARDQESQTVYTLIVYTVKTKKIHYISMQTDQDDFIGWHTDNVIQLKENGVLKTISVQ